MPPLLRIALAGLLAWIVPGLGHIYIGHRRRGIIFLVTITATFWSGVAIGGVRGTVDPTERKAWFMAELFNGGNTLAALAFHRTLVASATTEFPLPHAGHWLAVEVGIHYAGVAGLLNLLVILDVIVRADPTVRRRLTGGSVPQEGT
jgi:hypothetical protein